MAISRSQMRKQLYNTGGITGIVQRQPYFLGGIGKILKKGAKAVKGIVSSDMGKMALTAALMGAPFMGGGQGTWFGKGSMWGAGKTALSGMSVPKWMSGKAAKTIGAALIGGTLGTAFAGKTEEEVTELARDKDALKAYLRQYYTNVNPELSAHPEQVDTWVESQVKEYYADGGRIGYDNGGDVKTVSDPGMGEGPFMMEEFLQAVKDGFKGSYDEYIDQIDRSPADYLAQGGRIGYAHGSNDKVMMASGIEGIPINQNQAGINELDMRDRGGFIPPVGVKEKADDIPAMVSNNEFVMTADAVKGMGGGDVNRGAQKMYQLMETLENGGRV